MIIKGKLKQISSGFRKSKSTQFKYDFIEIGEYTIRKAIINPYLDDRLRTLFDQDIEVSIMPKIFPFPKTLVAIRTSDGQVYRDQSQGRFSKPFWGFLALGIIFFIFLSIPYSIVFGALGSFLEAIGFNLALSVITMALSPLILHYYITRKYFRHMAKAYNAFGSETSKNTVV